MKININSNQIKYDSGKALLVSIPHSRDSFWIPKKLVYDRDWYSTIYLPDDMKFNCIHGKEDKYELSAEELSERLTDVHLGNTSKVYHHIPKEMEAIDIEADSDLIR